MAVQISLSLVTAFTAKKSLLLLGFDALCDYRELHASSQCDYSASDGRVVDVKRNAMHE